MSLWILDTDHISLLQRGNPEVIARATQKTADEIAITIVTAEELIRGWLAVIRRAKSLEALGKGYIKLAETLTFLSEIQVVNFDPRAQAVYGQLRDRRLRIGTQDLRIAAIVLAANSILVTRNHQDFRKVGDLQLEDWTLDATKVP